MEAILNNNNDKPIEQYSYEEALHELEKTITSLESGEFSLEDTLALFERGQALARHCSILLEKAELKVKQLIGDNLEDFEPTAQES